MDQGRRVRLLGYMTGPLDVWVMKVWLCVSLQSVQLHGELA